MRKEAPIRITSSTQPLSFVIYRNTEIEYSMNFVTDKFTVVSILRPILSIKLILTLGALLMVPYEDSLLEHHPTV